MGGGTLALSEICELARVAGQEIDITGCRYGYHNRTKVDIGETEYYRFLAGLVRTLDAKQILEIGTHYGGSVMAMSRGAASDAKLVTVDIKLKNQDAFRNYPQIVRVTGRSTDLSVVAQVQAYLSGPVDVMYIDSLHTKEEVLANLKAYTDLRPQFAVLDDIHISDSMNDLWHHLCSQYETCDLSDIADRKRVGFGAVRL